MIKLAMFDTKEYDIESFNQYLKDKKDISIKYFEPKLNKDTASLAKGFDAVIVFVNDEIDQDVIVNLLAHNVKALFLRCAGYNNVDLEYANNKLPIYRVPAYSPYAVAEFAFALLQTSNRRIHKAYNRIREYNFSLSNLVGHDLHNKTIGIIGTGKIGKAMINIAKGYGMHILAYDKYPDTSLPVTYVDLDVIYQECDYISLHCPLNDETHHIINKDSINKMKKGVMIINTSRGGLIDAEALLEGIKSRHIGSACLDVYEEESDYFYYDKSNHIMNDNILLQLIAMPNVIITSHQAYLTEDALNNIAETTIKNIEDFFSNSPNKQNQVCYNCMK